MYCVICIHGWSLVFVRSLIICWLKKKYYVRISIVYSICSSFPELENQDFEVQTSDEVPVAGVTPAFSFLKAYTICARYGGSPPKSADVTLDCQPRAVGRYVYVHTPGKTALIICEVQVYGDPTGKPSGKRGSRDIVFCAHVIGHM